MGREICDRDSRTNRDLISMKKILVTGATGFVGNYVIAELLKTSHKIIASSSNIANAKEAEWFDRVTYIPFDLSNFDPSNNYYEFFQSPEMMIHLAWEGLPNYNSNFHLTANLPRHSALLENLIKNGLKDLTVTGTCLEYGFLEGKLNELMPANPSNPYAIAKNSLRVYLEAIKEKKPFELKWVRLFYMYGKGQNPNSLLSQLDSALAKGEESFNMSKGEQVRDYLPVEKVAEYIVRIALQNYITGIINCSSGVPIKVKSFVEDYLGKNGKKIALNLGYYPYASYEPMEFWGDNSKLNSILNG